MWCSDQVDVNHLGLTCMRLKPNCDLFFLKSLFNVLSCDICCNRQTPTSMWLRSWSGTLVLRPNSEPKRTTQPRDEAFFFIFCPDRTVNWREVQYLIREGARCLFFRGPSVCDCMCVRCLIVHSTLYILYYLKILCCHFVSRTAFPSSRLPMLPRCHVLERFIKA